jgi:hypothetical protein
MLFHLLANRPEMIGSILRSTPTWVWGLLAALVYFGLTQVRNRTVGLPRVAFIPFAMAGFSIWGMSGSFGSSPMFAGVLLAWAAVAALTIAAAAMMAPPAGASYDASAQTFALRGSWAPLAMILGIFLTRYWVNVEIAIQPALARDGTYALAVGALYGFFSGLFAGRALRLAKLARSAQAAEVAV